MGNADGRLQDRGARQTGRGTPDLSALANGVTDSLASGVSKLPRHKTSRSLNVTSCAPINPSAPAVPRCLTPGGGRCTSADKSRCIVVPPASDTALYTHRRRPAVLVPRKPLTDSRWTQCRIFTRLRLIYRIVYLLVLKDWRVNERKTWVTDADFLCMY